MDDDVVDALMVRLGEATDTEATRLITTLLILYGLFRRRVNEEVMSTLPRTVTEASVQRMTRKLLSIAVPAYSRFRTETEGKLLAIANGTAPSLAKEVQTLLGVPLALPDALTAVTVRQVPVRGAPVAEWWGGQLAQLQSRFGQALRLGNLAGETPSQILERITGQGGVLSIPRSQLQTLARTAAFAVHNESLLRTFKANPKLVRGVMAIATLDAKTTLICRPRHRMQWDLRTGKPLDKRTTITFPGPPPWHWNCRTLLGPVFWPLDG